jgi:hypothetical protein
LHVTQAASKYFHRDADRYRSKPLLFDPYHVSDHQITGEEKKYRCIKMPRLAPPASKLVPIIRELEKQVGIESGEDGRMALRSFSVVMQEMVARDPGKHGMPALPFFLGGGTEFPLIISFDGTGFGTGQFNTIAARNPYHPHSAQLLRVFGLGNCGDNRSGTTRLLGANRATINEMKDLSGDLCGECVEVDLGDGGKVDIKPHLSSTMLPTSPRSGTRSTSPPPASAVALEISPCGKRPRSRPASQR